MAKFRILIVDDEEDIRTLLKATLSTKYEVVEACNGLDALEKLERTEPDFVILDVMMPLMDGFETCASIRKNPKYSGLGVYFLTAKTDKEGIQKGYESGANLYLQKPFDPMRLLKNIDLYFAEKNMTPKEKSFTLEQLEISEKIPIGEKFQRKGSSLLRPGYLSPKEPLEKKEAKAPTQSYAVSPIPPRIIALSSDSHFLISIFSILKKDYEIIVEDRPQAAIEGIVNFQPEIILLDLAITGLDVFKFFQVLKQNKNLKYIEVLFVADQPSDRDLSLSRQSGNPLIIKNDTEKQILEKIATVCNKPNFHIYSKKLKYNDIYLDGIQRIREEEEERRKLKEREYFKLKHKSLESMFDGVNQVLKNKGIKKDNK